MEITRTFAPAFGKEAAILDRMFAETFGAVRSGRYAATVPPFAREAQADGPSPGSLRKKTSKKLRGTFGGLKITPYLCTRF